LQQGPECYSQNQQPSPYNTNVLMFVDKPMVLVSFDEIQFFTKQFAKFLLTAPRCELKLV